VEIPVSNLILWQAAVLMNIRWFFNPAFLVAWLRCLLTDHAFFSLDQVAKLDSGLCPFIARTRAGDA
jgi:hypothetical protein